jgi:hypothetical protein
MEEVVGEEMEEVVGEEMEEVVVEECSVCFDTHQKWRRWARDAGIVLGQN